MIPGVVPVGRILPRGVLVLLVVAALLLAPAATARAQEWREVLERAAEAARTLPYEGEALLVSVTGETSRSTTVRVRNSARGGLVVGGGDEWRVRLGVEGGGLVHEGEGRTVPLPAIDLGTKDDFRRLQEKYAVELSGSDRVMGRPCTTLAITRRSDGALRERLWVDDDSGLVLRRERYEGGEEPVRLATYLSLDLGRPAPQPRGAGHGAVAHAPAVAPSRPVMDEVTPRELAVLAESGWVVPGRLPSRYEPIGVYAVDAVASQPLQLVYSDGLYVVSVFQQRGRPDWSSLPGGARQVESLDFPAYEWPGAVPQRLVWAAGDRTWSLIGDAPQEELLALAGALPRAEPPRLLERLRRGLGRLWSWMTPW